MLDVIPWVPVGVGVVAVVILAYHTGIEVGILRERDRRREVKANDDD